MFYDNFEKACAFKGEKPNPVAIKCGGAKSSASSWKKGSSPNSEIVIKLAEYLNVSTDYLLLGKEPTIPAEYKKLILSYQKLSPENQQMALRLLDTMCDFQCEEEQRSQIKTLQIDLMINKASAGVGYDLDGAGFESVYVPDTPEAEEADFAVTIVGDSMLPDFKSGDVVLVKEQPYVEIGQVGIFTEDNDKGYIKERGDGYLISRNPEYDNIFPQEGKNIECKGLVLGKTEIIDK